MLYSPQSVTIKKEKPVGLDSSWRTDRIFNGDYWDEFGLVTPDAKNPRILVLGAGHGACVRPLIARTGSIDMTLVDSDPRATECIRREFANFFPQIPIRCVIADAIEHLQCEDRYDLIWIDLYTDQSFADCLYLAEFYERIALALKPKGVIAMNSFTVPSHFLLEQLGPSEDFFCKQLKLYFYHVNIFPFRRNVTITASNCSSSIDPNASNLQINDRDQIVMRTQRLRTLNPIKPKLRARTLPPLTFSETRALMTKLWRDHKMKYDVNELHKTLTSNQVNSDSIKQLTSLLKEASVVIATLAGSLGIENPSLEHAFLQAMLETPVSQMPTSRPSYIHYFLGQASAMLARNDELAKRYLEPFNQYLKCWEKDYER